MNEDEIKEAIRVIPFRVWEQFFEYRIRLTLNTVGQLSSDELVNMQTRKNTITEIMNEFKRIHEQN